jgi:hypothetical protein
LGLDRSARPSNSGDRAANALTTMLRIITRLSYNVRQVECWFSQIKTVRGIGYMFAPPDDGQE